MYCTTVGLHTTYVWGLGACIASLHCRSVGKAQMSASLSKRAELMQIFWSSIYTFWNQTPQPLFKSFSWIWNEIRKIVLSPENCGDIILSYLKKKMNAFVHSTECWVRWKIWNLPSNSNIGFCPHSVHASHLPLLQQWGGGGREAQKPFLGKQMSPAQWVPHVTAWVYSTHFIPPPPTNSFHKWIYSFYKFRSLLIKIHS